MHVEVFNLPKAVSALDNLQFLSILVCLALALTRAQCTDSGPVLGPATPATCISYQLLQLLLLLRLLLLLLLLLLHYYFYYYSHKFAAFRFRWVESPTLTAMAKRVLLLSQSAALIICMRMGRQRVGVKTRAMHFWRHKHKRVCVCVYWLRHTCIHWLGDTCVYTDLVGTHCVYSGFRNTSVILCYARWTRSSLIPTLR